MLYNCTRKMPHAYLELQYKYESQAYLKHTGESGCVMGKEWIYAWSISLSSPQILLQEGAVSLPLCNEMFLRTEVHHPSPTLPFCLFLETKTQVSSKSRAEGACVSPARTLQLPVSVQILAGLFWDCQSSAAENHQTFGGIPLCHFYYSDKKISDDVSS